MAARIALGLVLTLMACGGDSGASPNSGSLSYTYQLGEGSSIVISQGSGVPPTPSALKGTFGVVVSTALPPNTLIGLTITRVHLSGPGISVTSGKRSAIGCSSPQELSYGCISANTINRPPITFVTASFSVNGRTAEFFGTGPFEGDQDLPPYDGTTPPPPFNNLELCGTAPSVPVSCDDIRSGVQAGYALTIFAIPEIKQ